MAIVDPSQMTDVTARQGSDVAVSGRMMTSREMMFREGEALDCFWCGGNMAETVDEFWCWRAHSLIVMHLECLLDFQPRLGRDITTAARIVRTRE